jgi:hypothetical protein
VWKISAWSYPLLSRLFPNFGFQTITARGSREDLPCAGSDKLTIRLL